MPSGMATEAEARTRAAALYGAAPEGFIAGRNALADELKNAGEAEMAAAVKKLRKPSVVAWAVNVASREQRAQVTALLQAGDELRRAQQAAISGGGQAELRAATQARRAIVASLTDAATSALGDRAGGHKDAIASTFEAASVDPELGTMLREGTLEKEAMPGTGLGVPEGFQLLEGGGSKGARKDAGASAAERAAEAKEAERAATTAERDAEKATTRAEQLRAKARTAVEAADAAEADARRLEDEARTQRRRADRAKRA